MCVFICDISTCVMKFSGDDLIQFVCFSYLFNYSEMFLVIIALECHQQKETKHYWCVCIVVSSGQSIHPVI